MSKELKETGMSVAWNMMYGTWPVVLVFNLINRLERDHELAGRLAGLQGTSPYIDAVSQPCVFLFLFPLLDLHHCAARLMLAFETLASQEHSLCCHVV